MEFVHVTLEQKLKPEIYQDICRIKSQESEYQILIHL